MIFYQILSTNSLRKCTEISLKNFCVDNGLCPLIACVHLHVLYSRKFPSSYIFKNVTVFQCKIMSEESVFFIHT